MTDRILSNLIRTFGQNFNIDLKRLFIILLRAHLLRELSNLVGIDAIMRHSGFVGDGFSNHFVFTLQTFSRVYVTIFRIDISSYFCAEDQRMHDTN